MKRVTIILGLLLLLLPIAAWADAVDLTNQSGTITYTDAGVVSTGSQLVSFAGITAPKGSALGSVSFTTGAFTGSSLWQNGTFSSTGSTFDITGQGKWLAGVLGAPAKSKVALFTGSFVGPISWTVVSAVHANYVFNLSGTIAGALWTGQTVTGTTTQTIYSYTDQWPTDHKGVIHVGNSQLAVPEPGTLSLLGTGLLTIAGTMRRKLLRS
jgi:PEP-CTERM motif